MFKTFIFKTLIFIGISGLLLSSCSKKLEPGPESEPEPESLSNSARHMSELLMATSSQISSLTGAGLMLGVNGHPLGDAPYIATPAEKQVQLVKSMGMKWYRVNIDTYPDGTMKSLSLFNKLQQAAAAGSLNILPMVYTRTLNFSKTEAESYKAGKALGSSFATRYGKYFTYYDLGNDLELDLLLPKTTGQKESHYDRKKLNVTAAYLKGMDEGIKLKDPGAKTMIDAGWVHFAFLQMCKSYGVKYDIVAYHWYSDMENNAPKSPTNIPDITKKLSELFPDKPIWFTEINMRYKAGRPTHEADQNAFVTKFIAKCKANPQVKAVIIYELFNEPYKSPQEAHFGITKWTVPYTVYAKKLLANTLTLK